MDQCARVRVSKHSTIFMNRVLQLKWVSPSGTPRVQDIAPFYIPAFMVDAIVRAKVM